MILPSPNLYLQGIALFIVLLNYHSPPFLSFFPIFWYVCGQLTFQKLIDILGKWFKLKPEINSFSYTLLNNICYIASLSVSCLFLPHILSMSKISLWKMELLWKGITSFLSLYWFFCLFITELTFNGYSFIFTLMDMFFFPGFATIVYCSGTLWLLLLHNIWPKF